MLKFRAHGLTEGELEQHSALAEHQEHVRAHNAAKAIVDYHVAGLAQARGHSANAEEERLKAKVRLQDVLRPA